MTRPPSTFGAVYGLSVERIARRVEGLDAAALEARVPACPDWTVHDLLAHLVGGAADQLSGRVDGFPGVGWSARHVAERRDVPARGLLDALVEQAPAVARLCDTLSTRPNNAWDALVHEQDLVEALEPGPAPLRPGWDLVLDSGRALLARSRGLDIAVRERPRTGPWRVELAADGVRGTVTVDPYELFRAMFSRRTVPDMVGWGWSHDVSAILPLLPFFGAAEPA